MQSPTRKSRDNLYGRIPLLSPGSDTGTVTLQCLREEGGGEGQEETEGGNIRAYE